MVKVIVPSYLPADSKVLTSSRKFKSMSCDPFSGLDIKTGFAIETYPFVIGAFTEIRSGVIVLPLPFLCFNSVIEAIIGPCRQFDSTFSFNDAEDEPKMLGYNAAAGPIRDGAENSVSPKVRLSDEGDRFTNGLSACTDAGIANITADTKQIVITLFIFYLPPIKLTFQKTLFGIAEDERRTCTVFRSVGLNAAAFFHQLKLAGWFESGNEEMNSMKTFHLSSSSLSSLSLSVILVRPCA